MQLVIQVLGLHKAGVRQPDLKGDNVLVTENNEVFIVDAGSFAFELNEVRMHPRDQV